MFRLGHQPDTNIRTCNYFNTVSGRITCALLAASQHIAINVHSCPKAPAIKHDYSRTFCVGVALSNFLRLSYASCCARCNGVVCVAC